MQNAATSIKLNKFPYSCTAFLAWHPKS